MAHFAELNSSNEVLRVIVVSNDDVDANGGDLHADAETFVTTIVPYGTGSLISCDSTGNYFNFWMNGLQSERYYKFEFKVVSGSNTSEETIQYFDDDFVFKVVR